MVDVGDFNTQFRDDLSPAKEDEWQAARSRLVVGGTVCGVGLGFPTLGASRNNVQRLTPENSTTEDAADTEVKKGEEGRRKREKRK
jgi:hypothetical protein